MILNNSKMTTIVQYFIVNSDLQMTKGKICSQIAHCSGIIVENVIRSAYESPSPSQTYITYMKWKKNCTKIMLKATTNQLLELSKLPGAFAFYDEGRTTQIESGSLTVVGFYPGALDSNLVKDYQLL